MTSIYNFRSSHSASNPPSTLLLLAPLTHEGYNNITLNKGRNSEENPIIMAITGINHLWFYLLILTSILAFSRSDDPGDCVYSFYIQTAPFLFAGTDSKVSAIFSDRDGNKLQIGNIETWGGKMGSSYNYFEAGNLDTFSGKAPCLPGPICSLNLTIDGKGNLPAWYPNYLELTTTGDKTPCAKQLFTVNQWLGLPFSFSNSAVKNNCRRKAAVMKEEDSNDSSSGWPSFFADGVAF